MTTAAGWSVRHSTGGDGTSAGVWSISATDGASSELSVTQSSRLLRFKPGSNSGRMEHSLHPGPERRRADLSPSGADASGVWNLDGTPGVPDSNAPPAGP